MISTLISIEEAAKKLNLSEQRVRALCRSNVLRAKKISGSWVIESLSVAKFGLKKTHLAAENHGIYKLDNNSTNKKPIALSFFSGAMGLDLGIEKAGFQVRLVCEIDKYCRKTITLNKPEIGLLSDINNYSKNDVLQASGLTESDNIDLVMGGPPCQAFSTAGKRKSFQDDRGNVFLKYLDLALELKPKYIVIENVRGLLSCPISSYSNQNGNLPDKLKGGALNFILNKLKHSGYGYSFNLYNSANFGTPQIRERLIIICSKDGTPAPFLVPTHAEKGEYGLNHWRTFREATEGINSHHHINFPEKRLKYYRLLKAGENWKNLPEELQKEALGKSFYSGGGKTGFLRRLAWDKPSPTLVTHPAMPATDLAHPEEDRPLSVEEYKRIQEFPDDWELAGPLIQQYKQIGNAVPVSLGYAVGLLIKNLIEGNTIKNYPLFPYSRYKNTSNIEWENKFQEQLKQNNAKEKQLELVF